MTLPNPRFPLCSLPREAALRVVFITASSKLHTSRLSAPLAQQVESQGDLIVAFIHSHEYQNKGANGAFLSRLDRELIDEAELGQFRSRVL